jgi:hypothetical protein
MLPNKLSTILKTVMIVVVFAVVATAGWEIWKHVSKGPIVDSYQACADAGNPIQLSYPSVCVTKDGKRFVNPTEHVD